MDLWSEAKFSRLDFVLYLIYNPRSLIFDIRLIKEAGRNFYNNSKIDTSSLKVSPLI